MNDKLTPGQRNLIWKLAGDRGMDEDTLRSLVNRETGDTSISKMTKSQANKVINALAEGSVRSKTKYKELDGRPGMATSAQLRKIEAMWADRARASDKAKSLREFLGNRHGVSDLKFLKRDAASEVIVGLEKMELRSA